MVCYIDEWKVLNIDDGAYVNLSLKNGKTSALSLMRV